MSEEIVWEDPPETALNVRRRSGYTPFAEALRASPGRWAVLPGERKSPESAKNTAQNLKRGMMRDFARGEFEVAVDGKKVYVRFAVKKPAVVVAGERDTTGENVPSSDGERGEEEGAGSRTWEAHRVRLWAQENGHQIGDRGRMSNSVWEAYDRAHAGNS